jgi:hypothetical protein
MIPSSDVYEAAWKILTGLLLGGLLGGLGVGLLVRAVWQWLRRSRQASPQGGEGAVLDMATRPAEDGAPR